MGEDREAFATNKFNCSKRERALFEAGIKMGTIYHQFVGTPFNEDSVEKLEESIMGSIKVQPYVKDVKVRIDRQTLGPKVDKYSYTSLTGDMLDVVLIINIDGEEIVSEMRYDHVLKYPLMYISEIR